MLEELCLNKNIDDNIGTQRSTLILHPYNKTLAAPFWICSLFKINKDRYTNKNINYLLFTDFIHQLKQSVVKHSFPLKNNHHDTKNLILKDINLIITFIDNESIDFHSFFESSLSNNRLSKEIKILKKFSTSTLKDTYQFIKVSLQFAKKLGLINKHNQLSPIGQSLPKHPFHKLTITSREGNAVLNLLLNEAPSFILSIFATAKQETKNVLDQSVHILFLQWLTDKKIIAYHYINKQTATIIYSWLDQLILFTNNFSIKSCWSREISNSTSINCLFKQLKSTYKIFYEKQYKKTINDLKADKKRQNKINAQNKKNKITISKIKAKEIKLKQSDLSNYNDIFMKENERLKTRLQKIILNEKYNNDVKIEILSEVLNIKLIDISQKKEIISTLEQEVDEIRKKITDLNNDANKLSAANKFIQEESLPQAEIITPVINQSSNFVRQESLNFPTNYYLKIVYSYDFLCQNGLANNKFVNLYNIMTLLNMNYNQFNQLLNNFYQSLNEKELYIMFKDETEITKDKRMRFIINDDPVLYIRLITNTSKSRE